MLWDTITYALRPDNLVGTNVAYDNGAAPLTNNVVHGGVCAVPCGLAPAELAQAVAASEWFVCLAPSGSVEGHVQMILVGETIHKQAVWRWWWHGNTESWHFRVLVLAFYVASLIDEHGTSLYAAFSMDMFPDVPVLCVGEFPVGVNVFEPTELLMVDTGNIAAMDGGKVQQGHDLCAEWCYVRNDGERVCGSGLPV